MPMSTDFEKDVAVLEKKLSGEIAGLTDEQFAKRFAECQERFNEDPDNYETVLERDLLINKLIKKLDGSDLKSVVDNYHGLSTEQKKELLNLIQEKMSL